MKAIFRFTITAIALNLLAACAPVADTPQSEATTEPSASSASTAAYPPGAIPPSFFAMNTVNPADYPKLTFGTLAHPEIGAWAWIEQKKGVYDFSLFDHDVSNAIAHGLLDKTTNTVSLAITLGTTPPWAAADAHSCATNKGMARCTSGPANIQDWSDFIVAMVRHYNGITEPHVRYYELWNEMNINLFWTGTQAEMLALAKAAYPIIHADPHSMLLTPSVAGPVGDVTKDSATTWMASYLDAGGAQYADGGAFHGYIAQRQATQFPMPEEDSTPGCPEFTTCYGSIVTRVTLMRQVFDQHGLARKPIFQTEGSWGDGTLTDPDTQAAWLARWYLLQAGLRSSDNLQMSAWFTWGDPRTFNWGTIEDDSLEPTQAGLAFNQVYSWLVGAVMSSPCSSPADGTWTCSLTRPGGYSAVAVWNTQGSKSFTPNATYADYRDLKGNTIRVTAGTPVPIGAKPILLETSPTS